MNTPTFKGTVSRQWPYWRWTVREVFQGKSEVFTEGLCFRHKTAVAKMTSLIKQERDFWKLHNENWEATRPPPKFEK